MHRSSSMVSLRRQSSRTEFAGGMGRQNSGSESPAGHRPTSRASWKVFKDDSTDISAAMEAVKLVMKSKNKSREASEMQSRIQESNRRIIREAEEAEAREAERLARIEEEREKAVAALGATMKRGNLKGLQKAIDNAVALDVSSTLISEARAFWNLESHLQTALAIGKLDKIRKVVADVERGKALAAFPREPPFACQQPLQYWSEKRSYWVNCHVTDTSDEGHIQISLRKKAGHWFSLTEQREKFRTTCADIAAVAPMVCLKDANALLRQADALEAALLSENVDEIRHAILDAGKEKALSELVKRGEAFIQEALKARAEAEAARRSNVAAAWHAAKKNIRSALRAAAEEACSEADGAGWDDLEKDLVMERLGTLQKSFDSTSLVGLELALKQLETEDLKFPVPVIEEASNALYSIRRQHDMLEEAISDGDIHAIAAAIELASEHFLPEALVRKARTVLETAIPLDRAIRSRDLQLLSSTISQIDRDFPCVGLVQRGCSIVHAAKELQEALRGDDIAAVRSAMELVEEQYLPETLVRKARYAASLDTAIKSQDSELLSSVLSRVERHCGEMLLIERAQDMLNALEGLKVAIQGADMNAIKEAIRVAEAEGILAQRVSSLASAHAIVAAAEALQRAMLGNDEEALLEGIKLAKAQGVPNTLLQEAQKRVVRRASISVEAALQLGDEHASEEAIRNAEALGLPEALINQFRQQLSEQRAKKLTDAVQAAVLNVDEEGIEDAIRHAEAQGLPEALICEFRERLVELKVKKASDAVNVAVQANDVDGLQEAIHIAEAQGLSQTLIAQFREQLAELKVNQAIDAVLAAMQGVDIDAIEKAINAAEAEGAEVTVISKFRQDFEEKRVNKAIENVRWAMQGSDVDAIEAAIQSARSHGVPATLMDKFQRELEEQRSIKEHRRKVEKVLSDLQALMIKINITALREAIAEGEALGLDQELEPSRKVLEEELSRRLAKAKEKRAKQEKLAAEFKDAKEAQDFGGSVIAAQWRAAAAAVAKPFAFSEEDEEEAK